MRNNESFKLILRAWLCLLLACSFVAAADDELSQELVEQRLQLVADMPESEAKSELDASYRIVLSSLQQAAEIRKAEEDYTAAVVDAPSREREIRQRIEEMPDSLPAGFLGGLDTLTPAQLDAELASKRSERASMLAEIGRLDERLSSRETNEAQRRDRILAIGAQLRELPAQFAAVQAAALPSASEAASWQAIAKRQALLAEDRSLDAASVSQPARYSLLRAQRAELQRLTAVLELEIDALERRVVSLRRQKTEEARAGEEALATKSSTLASLAAQNVSFSAELEVLSADLASIYGCRTEVQNELTSLADRFASTRRRVEFARSSPELGHILLAELNAARMNANDQHHCEFDRSIGSLVIQRIDYEEQLQRLDRIDSYLDSLADEAGEALAAEERSLAVEMSHSQRKMLTDLIALQSSYIEVASDLLAITREEGRLRGEYRNFLSAYLLWVQSHPRLSLDSLIAIPHEVSVVAESMEGLSTILKPSWQVGTALLLFFLLLVMRRRFTGWQERLSKNVGRARSDSIGPTFAAIAATLLEALPWPVLVFGFARVIAQTDMSLATDISFALQGAAWLMFILLFLRNAVQANGVGPLHFQWRQENCATASRELGWLLKWWFPLMVVASILYRLGLASPEAGGVRLLSLFTAVIFVRRLWRIKFDSLPSDAVAGLFISRLPLLRNIFLLFLGLVVFIVLGGYLYSAAVITRGLLLSGSLVAILIFFYAVMYRWSLIMRRKVRFRELVADSSDEEEKLVKEERVSLNALSVATAKLLKFSVMVLGILGLWFIWAPTLPALDVLNDFVLWTSTSTEGGVTFTQNVTLATIFGIVILAMAVVYAARDVPSLIELVLLQYPSVSSGSRYTITTLIGYVIFAGGAIALLGMLGLRWGQLQWLVAALGVGIGFGLQEIVANFISGLIILFERPIRVGDIVTIGETDGVITKIRIRATTLRDWNGKELVVPNKEFITGRLLNWSLSDSNTRIVLNVGIAYGSDVERALTVLEEIVRENPDVLDEPKPSIIMTEFGDNALLLTARYFVPSVEYLWLTKSELNRTIYKRFNEEGIVIAFPQRDVHFDAEAPIRIQLEQPQT